MDAMIGVQLRTQYSGWKERPNLRGASMNRRDLKPIHGHLLRSLPGFASHKRLLLMNPMHGMLRAIHFDPSAFSKEDFYVQTITMPLCVPADHLSLMFGDRLRHPRSPLGWASTLPDLIEMLLDSIKSQALPFLDSIQSANDFAIMARKSWDNPHAPKQVAFVLARDGQYERAIRIIDHLLPTLHLDVSWEQAMFDQVSALRHLLATDPDEAQRKFLEWEDYTIGKLGLDGFR
jgi:hypothetical protein